MTMTRRPSPFGELLSLRQAMDRLFEDSFVRPRAWAGGSPEGGPLPLDVTSDADALVIMASLPGIGPDDVEITVEDGTLTITGQSREETRSENGTVLLREIRRGSVSRTVTLPAGLEADKAQATFENGVLELRIPRAEEVKPRQIRITPTTATRSTTPAEAGRPAGGAEAGTRA